MIDLIAGSYSGAGGGALRPLTYDPAGERIVVGLPVGDFRDASFGLRLSASAWCFVDEGASQIVIAGLTAGRWLRISAVNSGGDGPCHLAFDPASMRLAVANYGDGAVALFQLDPITGKPVAPPLRFVPAGHGPDPRRQTVPHAHWVGFSHGGTRLYSVDLGLDRLFLFDLTGNTLGEPRVAYTAPPGSGPRHVAFHPALPIAYLVSELASTLTVLQIEPDGRLTPRRILSTLPAGAGGHSDAGAIVIDGQGRRLYVSNRGHDSIATFAVDARGDVALIDMAPSGGSSPRFLLLLERERCLLVAHDKADGVTVLTTGPYGLEPARAHADVAGAAFLAMIDKPR